MCFENGSIFVNDRFMGVLIKSLQNWACKHLKQQLRRKEPMKRTISGCVFINKSQESSKKMELAMVPTQGFAPTLPVATVQT